MSDASGSQVTDAFATLFGSDSQRWNHDQHNVAATVYELLLESTTITESDLMEHINQLVIDNPEAYRTDGSGKTLSDSKAVELPLIHALHDERQPAGPSQSSKKAELERIKQRLLRLHKLIAKNLQDPERRQVSDVCVATTGNRPVYGGLSECGRLLEELKKLEDANLKTRMMDKACMGTTIEDEDHPLTNIRQAVENLERGPYVMKSAAMSIDEAANPLRHLRVYLGLNTVKASKGKRLRPHGGAVDLVGPREGLFQVLLSCGDRQLAVAKLLAELGSQDVEKNYQTFAGTFAREYSKGTWPAKTCDEYGEELIKQESLIIEAFERKRQQETKTQPSGSLEEPQVAGKSLRSSLSPYLVGNQSSESQVKKRRRRTEDANPPQIAPTNTDVTNRQSQSSPDALESQYNSVGKAARGSMQSLTKDLTPTLGSQRPPRKPTKLNVRLDMAGPSGNKTSRHLRWSPDDTRDVFFHKVAELFPGTAIQQVTIRLLQGTPVTVQATGPEGEWEIVREEWLERLEKPSKKLKEPSADVHLVESME